MDSLEFIKSLKLPFVGYRDYSTAEVYYQGVDGYYWSSTPYDANKSYFLIVGSDGTLHPDGKDVCSRSDGISVRCFKNSLKNPPKTYSLNLLAASGSMVATGEVQFDEGTHLLYGEQVINVIKSIKNALLLSEKYFIEWYKINAQGEQEKVEIKNLDITETTSLSGTVKKRNMCKQPQYYHGALN